MDEWMDGGIIFIENMFVLLDIHIFAWIEERMDGWIDGWMKGGIMFIGNLFV